ncbi:tumor necrosis factor receptor superfamily member 1B isoform X2 [Megalobrama amblycephala]|uniref:tumor necrosis factor receptor superfamily member 1B isoform X2 n=1 Tax=Megalobrama amblycephala TaxID=75352 RepID=UPI0020147244|nr:tumor necrosis factor receptor superfamily member 1B isoform X2 [Megalobrama amblycephala]
MLILISRLILMTAVWRVAEGKASLPYSSEGKCNDLTSEYYAKDLQICCSKCKPGTRQHVQCTRNSDTVCEPCQQGQYSENYNHFKNCFSCPQCKDEKGLAYGTKCSADTKSVCVCKPGMFCSKIGFLSECEECRKYKSCKPGEYTARKGTPKNDVKCEKCQSGTFSNHINAESCQPHTQCEGGSVLRQGSSTADTLCDVTPPPLTNTTEVSLQSSPKHPHPRLTKPSSFRSLTAQPMNATTTPSLLPSSSMTAIKTTNSSDTDTPTLIYCTVIVCGVLVLLALTLMVITCKLRKRKGIKKVPVAGGNKLVQDASENGILDHQCLLHADKCQKEPSMTSSDSQSQPDSSQSHSSGDWLERASQEESLPEQPSVSSPLVNLSITATFNCQVNPTTASCSIPLNPSALTPHVEAPVPLSQEEVCISCQQEDGKEALQSVQESSPCAF